MKKIQLSQTGVEVSCLCLGTLRFGTRNNYEQAAQLMDMYVEADGWASFTCVEQRCTYLRANPGVDFGLQQIADRNLMSYCDARGETMLPYTPLLRGAYVRSDRPIPSPYRSSDTDVRLEVLHEVAQELEESANQVVLAWMMRRQPPLLPVFSAGNPEQMKENLDALNVALSAEQMERLDRAGYCLNDEPV